MKSIFVGIKNILLWSYERGTWQYDVLCLLIIGAIFLLPGKFFGDRDRVDVQSVNVRQANENRISASKPGATIVEVSLSDLQAFLQRQNRPELILNSPKEALVLYLRDQRKQDVIVNNFKSFMNPQGRVGYKVWIE